MLDDNDRLWHWPTKAICEARVLHDHSTVTHAEAGVFTRRGPRQAPQPHTHVKARFNDPDDPLAFLIVTAKLLTGFDARIEQAMYLDKPLRKHTLFQAITRTNRRFAHPATGHEKTHGLIVDYIGLGNQIAAALKAADPDTAGKRDVDVDALAVEFEDRIAVAVARFDGIDRKDASFVSLQDAIQRLAGVDAKDGLASDFTAVATLWEFLDPHEVLDLHKADYKWLAKVYEAIKPTGVINALLWHRLGPKTVALVHGNITDLRVTGTGLEHSCPRTLSAVVGEESAWTEGQVACVIRLAQRHTNSGPGHRATPCVSFPSRRKSHPPHARRDEMRNTYEVGYQYPSFDRNWRGEAAERNHDRWLPRGGCVDPRGRA